MKLLFLNYPRELVNTKDLLFGEFIFRENNELCQV